MNELKIVSNCIVKVIYFDRGIVRKSCIVVCNSPPFGLPSRECAEDYFGKTVEELAEEMGRKVRITE